MKVVLVLLFLTAVLAIKVGLPPCGGCYMGQNGIDYQCCNGARMSNNQCSCPSGPCVQCMPSLEDKEMLPSCGDCYTSFNGINYACCNGMSLNNGACTCQGQPCTQCETDHIVEAKPELPSCGDCWSSFNGVDYTCSDCKISIMNNQCSCGNGSPCQQCGQ